MKNIVEIPKIYSIGIDPGINGGIAATYNKNLISVEPMPSSAVELRNMFIFLGLKGNYKGELKVYLEDVHSMPTDGVASAFKFGWGVGLIEGVLGTMNIDYIKVTPQKWMESFKLKKDKANDESTYQYKKRIYELALKLTKNKIKFHQNQADSVMISLYGGSQIL